LCMEDRGGGEERGVVKGACDGAKGGEMGRGKGGGRRRGTGTREREGAGRDGGGVGKEQAGRVLWK